MLNFIRNLNIEKNLRKKRRYINITLDISNLCNLNCRTCFRHNRKSPKPILMNIEDIEKVLKGIHPYVDTLMLSCGAEPLTSPDFEDIVSNVSKKYPQIRLKLCTNGVLLNSKKRKAIIENQVYRLNVSMDGATKKTVEDIRTGTNYEKVIKNLLALKELKKKYNTKYPILQLNFVVMKSNINEALKFVEVAKYLGADLIVYRNVMPFNENVRKEELLDDIKPKFNHYRKKILEKAKELKIKVLISEEFKNAGEFKESIPEIDLSELYKINPDKNFELVEIKRTVFSNRVSVKPKNVRCNYPFWYMMITPGGDIRVCPGCKEPISNIHKESPDKLFFGDIFKNRRKILLKGGITKECERCHIMKNTRNIHKSFD